MSDSVTGGDDPVDSGTHGEGLCTPFTALLPVSGASISMFGSGGIHSTVCTSDPLATALDALHLKLGEGPRWEVARTGYPALSSDLVRDANPSWPLFSADAAALGVRALFAFPIAIGGITIGAVDLYRLTAGPLGIRPTALLRSLIRAVASAAVAEAVGSADRDDSTERADAPALRREVHQATGMLLVQLDVAKDDALALLRAHAFATGRSLDDVAGDVVARRLDFRDLRD